MIQGKYRLFLDRIQTFIDQDRIITDPLRRLAYGTDASFYRLIPQIVVNVIQEHEVVQLLKAASQTKVSVTFRAAGTSLSGQAVTDSVLVRLGKGWQHHRIYDDAQKIELEPGIIGAHANRFLAGFGKKIGPDPASIDTAKIGGIIANNASGMCCGVVENSYKTLLHSRVILADGTLVDTGDPESRNHFAQTHSHILSGLTRIKDAVLNDADLAKRIRHKFKIKNTTGYSINAFIDFQDPFDILQHLMVGSEGTLGFISRVTYQTVVEHPHKASALILFPDIKSACQATIVLKKQPVSAVELMDRASLRSVQEKEGMPDFLKSLGPDAAALLVETRAGEHGELISQIQTIISSLETIEKEKPIDFKEDPAQFNALWNIRKGLFPAVGSVRKTGTTVIIEDVAFPIERLADATLELQALFKKYHYNEAIIFGHALEGNLHFVFTQDFSSKTEIDRYAAFMDDVAAMVVDTYDGSLKAEHGTGRNMAPYVEMEWGKSAFDLMKQVKLLLDPENLLNPGVIINDDPSAHIKDLKPLPPAHDLVDKCIECGFCEPICPSKDITLTPRQRIAAWREINRLKNKKEKQTARNDLLKSYGYYGDATCATDGLCGTRCPIGIDTGKLTKTIRSDNTTRTQKKIADWTGDHFKVVTAGMKKLLIGADLIHQVLGTEKMAGLTEKAHELSSHKIPRWNMEMPKPGPVFPKKHLNTSLPEKVVYFPSCTSRTFGPSRQNSHLDTLPMVTASLLDKAGIQVILPENLENLCCGQAFESKGFIAQADKKAAELDQALLDASKNGTFPVLCDTSPCLYRMKQTLDTRLTLFEPIIFVLETLQSNLVFEQQDKTIALHLTCTSRKMGLENKFLKLAQKCATRVVVPQDIHCCGFAGDKGFSHPELNASALEGLDGQVKECREGYSTSLTCEIGLSLHGRIPYRSILYLVDESTRTSP